MKDVFKDPIKGFGVLSDYGRKHARLSIGLGGDSKLQNLHEAIQPQAEVFEIETRVLALPEGAARKQRLDPDHRR